ncbi:PREDICTED: protein ZNF365, partial [Tauraco erythrolophus]|uniref:protein ZNF365 n=1 Tax=Tauraco erythrolophus TaxID=121530 RepID=UPI000523A830
YEERSLLSQSSLFSPRKDAELISPPEPATPGSLGSPGGAVQRKGSFLNFGDASCEGAKRGQPLEGEAEDKTIEKRIDKLTKELAQKTAELLEVRAAFVQLSQKKQEVQRRERALSRQVDVAVEMIAALKQRLSESEEELHRKEE